MHGLYCYRWGHCYVFFIDYGRGYLISNDGTNNACKLGEYIAHWAPSDYWYPVSVIYRYDMGT